MRNRPERCISRCESDNRVRAFSSLSEFQLVDAKSTTSNRVSSYLPLLSPRMKLSPHPFVRYPLPLGLFGSIAQHLLVVLTEVAAK